MSDRRTTIRTLLVRLPNPVGDVVAATPLLASLRAALPQARLLAAGRAPAAELLAGSKVVDDYVAFSGRKGLAGVESDAARLRAADPDACILLPNSWSSALAAWRAGIPLRVGRGGRGRSWLLTEKLPPIGAPRPMAEIYLEMLAPLGIPALWEAPRLAVTAEEEARAEARLQPAREAGLDGPYLGVAPGAAFGPSKIYPLEMTAAAVAEARERTGLIPLLLGGPGEEQLLHELAVVLPDPFISTHENVAGLGELKALLRRCAALFTMDTGARHVAAALGVPQVVLYGPTDPRWSAAYLDRTKRLRREEVECSPCHKKVCPIDHRCMTGIRPGEVAAALERACGGAGLAVQPGRADAS